MRKIGLNARSNVYAKRVVFPDGSPCLSMHRRRQEGACNNILVRCDAYGTRFRRCLLTRIRFINIRKASRAQISSRDSWFGFSIKQFRVSRVTRPLGAFFFFPISIIARFVDSRRIEKLKKTYLVGRSVFFFFRLYVKILILPFRRWSSNRSKPTRWSFHIDFSNLGKSLYKLTTDWKISWMDFSIFANNNTR